MQQTETYKLNLIEKTDSFSPDPMNENTRKVEEALETETAALDQWVTILEAHHIYVGSYTGTGEEQIVQLGFTPTAVLILADRSWDITMLTAENPRFNAMFPDTFFLRIVEGGFQAANGDSYGI